MMFRKMGFGRTTGKAEIIGMRCSMYTERKRFLKRGRTRGPTVRRLTTETERDRRERQREG